MITVTWGKPDKSILQYEFEGSWTIDDLIEALDAGVDVTNKYDHDIDVVVDLLQSGFPDLFGSNINKAFQKAMNRTEEYMAKSEREAGVVVIVSNNAIIRNTLSTLLTMYQRLGDKILLANSRDEAQKLIACYRGEQVERIPA